MWLRTEASETPRRATAESPDRYAGTTSREQKEEQG